MKKLLLIPLALLALAASSPPGTFPLTFSWDAPTDQPLSNLTYKLYGTTNLASPTNTWPLLATIQATNAVKVGTRLYSTNYFSPAAYFFTMSVTNTGRGFWGEIFSAAVDTPPAPPQFNNLQLNP